MSDLFRKEAVRHSVTRLSGEIILTTPIPLKVIAALAIVLVLAAVLFLTMATYARKETATGLLVPDGGLITVTTQGGGQVEKILVKEGGSVTAGTVLLTVRLGDSGAQQGIRERLDNALAIEAVASRKRLDADLLQLASERNKLLARRSRLQEQVVEVRHGVELQSKRLTLAHRSIERAQTLADRGYGSGGAVDVRTSEALAMEGDLGALKSQLLQLYRDLDDAKAAIAALPAQEAGLRSDFATQKASQVGRAASSDNESIFVATASANAEVLALPLGEGQAAPPGATLAILRPTGSKLEAELIVPSRAAGFVRPGQTVQLSYSAFPNQRFGRSLGVVRSISRTVLAPAEAGNGRVPIKEPGFRVRVTLDRQAMQAYGEAIPLQPGMEVAATIVIERRSLAQWLLDPIRAIGRSV